MENKKEIGCEECLENLAAYHDYEHRRSIGLALPEEKKLAVDEHLKSCQECQSDFEWLKETIREYEEGRLAEPFSYPRCVLEGRENCPSEKEFSVFLDGEIRSRERQKEIEEHLKGCSFCQEEVRRDKILGQMVKQMVETCGEEVFVGGEEAKSE